LQAVSRLTQCLDLVLFLYFWSGRVATPKAVIDPLTCLIAALKALKVYRDYANYVPSQPAIVTVGTFDGVHIGHQKILSRIAELAKTGGMQSVLLTFFPHPRMVLFPDDNDLRLLSTMDEKIELVRKLGIEHLIIHPFSKAFSRMSAEAYVEEILVQGLNVRTLVIGHDHHFGRNREGNLEELTRLSEAHGFELEEIPAQEISAVNVSSTKIRQSLADGDIAKANSFLGYPYGFQGRVVAGNQLGRTLGFPTANLQAVEPLKRIPAQGAYAGLVKVEGATYQAMINIGVRPTIGQNFTTTIEVHLLDFDGDLYGKTLSIDFYHRLRPEIKFENTERLKEQLSKDAAHAKSLLDSLA